MGDYQKAHEHLGLALPLSRAIGERRGEATTLYALAGVERDRGRFSEAQAYTEDAIKIIESLRAKVAGAELRTSYLAAHQGYYELYIDLLMRLHEQSPASGHDALVRCWTLSPKPGPTSVRESTRHYLSASVRCNGS